MADFQAIAEYFSSPPKPTSEQDVFEQAGMPAIFDYKGTTLGWPMCAERHRWAGFEARPSDIWVSSLPRTGTTWTQEIIHSLLHLHRMDEADAKTLSQAFPYLELTMPPDLSSIDVATALPEPRTIKTHLPYDALPDSVKSVKPKIVYICRNPKDFAVAFYHFVAAWPFIKQPEGYTFQDFLRSIMNNKLIYTPIFPHMFGFWQRRHEPNILFLKYEDLKKDLPSNIRRIAAFIGVSSKGLAEGELSDEDVAVVAQRASIDHMRASKHANLVLDNPKMLKGDADAFIRKGIVGDWRNYFDYDSDPTAHQYDEWIRHNLEGSGLEFDYE